MAPGPSGADRPWGRIVSAASCQAPCPPTPACLASAGTLGAQRSALGRGRCCMLGKAGVGPIGQRHKHPTKGPPQSSETGVSNPQINGRGFKLPMFLHFFTISKHHTMISGYWHVSSVARSVNPGGAGMQGLTLAGQRFSFERTYPTLHCRGLGKLGPGCLVVNGTQECLNFQYILTNISKDSLRLSQQNSKRML